MSNQTPTEIAELINRKGLGALADTMGIKLEVASPELVVATMPVAGNTQPYGLLHGGANVVLAETIGSLAGNLHAGPDRIAVGVDINATHLKSATSGIVTATSKAVRLGGTVAVFEIEIRDEAGDLTCLSRLTCALRAKK
jgi:1,4-dihydroxy-2-naphthoyl-CoA hydrolase